MIYLGGSEQALCLRHLHWRLIWSIWETAFIEWVCEIHDHEIPMGGSHFDNLHLYSRSRGRFRGALHIRDWEQENLSRENSTK